MKKNLTLGNLKKMDLSWNGHKYWMPILEIKRGEKISGYLSPFRFYRFQVSRTFEGQTDLGASDVNRFENYIFGDHEADFNSIREYMKEALEQHCDIINRAPCWYHGEDGVEYTVPEFNEIAVEFLNQVLDSWDLFCEIDEMVRAGA